MTSSRSTLWPICLALVPILALAGCGSIQVGLGMKVHLAKTPVTSMAAQLSGDPGLAPGQKEPLIATFAGVAGKTWLTEGAGKGKIMWSELSVTATVVTVNKKGVVSLARDPRISDGKTGHVTITAPSHPDLRADIDIPFRYDIAFVSSYAGPSGSDGMNGTNGSDGLSGSPGSMDPNNPSAGGNGGDGTNGSDGTNGGDGGNGPPVQVFVTLRSGPHPLLQVGITAPGHKERFYLVDPQGGSLTIRDLGGSGGRGGSGGKGGSGGSGGIGQPNGSDGHSGMDGSDGRPGSDGRAGPIAVTYDPTAKPYIAALKLSNPGGPAPQLQQAPVAPLW
jgi:hypothetical protein